jgi:hypothetical protein
MVVSMDERIATCNCGSLRVTVRGEPADVYACSCASCQRKSGSAFSYAAVYAESDVAIAGEHRTWHRRGDSGRFIESGFCPTCGTSVFFQAEGLPGMVGIAAGCFADPNFLKPRRLFWASRRHRWLELGEVTALLETQPD